MLILGQDHSRDSHIELAISSTLDALVSYADSEILLNHMTYGSQASGICNASRFQLQSFDASYVHLLWERH